MTSRDGIKGLGPDSAFIRATADRKPLVRLINPSDDLRLSPHDIVSLQYEAMDDYGLGNLTVQVQLNSQPPWSLPIKLSYRSAASGGNLQPGFSEI